jgi:hypothetical protein
LINLLESYKGFCAPPASPLQIIGESTFLVKDKKEIRSTKIEEKIKVIKQIGSYFHILPQNSMAYICVKSWYVPCFKSA